MYVIPNHIEAERDIAVSALDRLDNLDLYCVSDRQCATSIIMAALAEIEAIELANSSARAVAQEAVSADHRLIK